MYRKSTHSLMKHKDFILLDILMLVAAFFLAYYLRFGTVADLLNSSLYRRKLLLVIASSVAVAALSGSYKSILRRGETIELGKTVLHVSLVVGVMLIVSFTVKEIRQVSRLFVGLFYVCSVVFLYAERLLWKRHILLHYPKNKRRRLMLVAGTEDADTILDRFAARSFIDFEIVGLWLTDAVFPDGGEAAYRGIPIVANNTESAVAFLEKTPISGVVFSESRSEDVVDLIRKCQVMGLTVHVTFRQMESLLGESVVEKLGGISVVSSSIRLVSSQELFLKRAMDILGSAVGLVVTGIALIFVAPLVYMADPGPIFFRQKRIGEGGKVFDCYKIRSMYTDAEERKKELMEKNQMTGYMFKMDNDPRVIGSGADGTRHGIGWFIRSFSIDELPQFWNVMKGDMSLVGTRPPTVEVWEHYDMHHRVRMRVRPGITGLWQVSGRNEITDFEEVVRLDQKYIKTWSIWLDIKILLKTVVVVIRRKGSK